MRSPVAGGSHPPLSDRTVDLLLAGVGGLVGFALLAGVGVWAATVLAAGHPPGGGLLAGGLRLLAHPTDPAAGFPPGSGVPGPFLVWALVGGVMALAGGLGWVGWRALRQQADPDPAAARLPGTAGPGEVARLMGERALLAKAALIRPSLSRPHPTDVGLSLGRVHGRAVWGSWEDSYLLVAPPRAGKGVHVVIPAVLDAPGPVLAPSTKPDTLTVTLSRRRRVGPVAVFDPQQLAETGADRGLRWSPVRGCADPLVAILRARALVEAAHVGRGVSDADFWSSMSQAVVRALLHAAALDGRDPATVLRWTHTPANQEPVRILRAACGAAPGWADELDAQAGADPRQRDSVWAGVRRAFDALADPRVLAAVSPRDGDEFDPETFLRQGGTLYLLGTSGAQLSVAPLITALVEDVTETARRLAAAAPHGRLDPPLLLALDEAANIAPLPSLPSLLADGGGVGLSTLAVLQSMAQARHRWGEHAASAMWDAATIKLVLGGLGNTRDLDDLTRLAGERDQPTTSTTRDLGGARSTSTSLRRLPVLPVEAIRNLPFGTALLLHRTARPALTALTPWWDRPEGRRRHR